MTRRTKYQWEKLGKRGDWLLFPLHFDVNVLASSCRQYMRRNWGDGFRISVTTVSDGYFVTVAEAPPIEEKVRSEPIFDGPDPQDERDEVEALLADGLITADDPRYLAAYADE